MCVMCMHCVCMCIGTLCVHMYRHTVCLRVYRHTMCAWVWRPVADTGDLCPLVSTLYIEAGSIALNFR